MKKKPYKPKVNNIPNPKFHPTFGDLAHLSPSYFAMVMATGIVSLAAHLYNWELLAHTLFYFNILAYGILSVLYVLRCVFFRQYFITDLKNAEKNMGFLSFVAASCILGSQFILIARNMQVGTFFLLLGFFSGTLLCYFLFTVLIVKRIKPSLQAVSGTWLLLVVAMQAVVVLTLQLLPSLPFPQLMVLFFALMLFLCGSLFYIIIITLIFYRLIFYKLQAEYFGPSYWINMGADAITVLSGSLLVIHAHEWPVMAELLPFLKGWTLIFWAIGSWWVPLIIILGIWRHLIKKITLKYHSQYWVIIFPLGMYTVATLYLAQAIKLPWLAHISFVFALLALVSWASVFVSLLYFLLFSPARNENLKP